MDFRADLHCHTTCSDGTLTVEETIALAKQIGLSGLSITDHDTVQAYQTAGPIAEQMNIELISGVEFSADLDGHSVHLLGYAFTINHPKIKALCEGHIVRRKARNLAILNRLAKRGMSIAEGEIIEEESRGTIGRVHIAKAMVKKRYVGTIQEAFSRYIGEGCPCFDPGESYSVTDTVECIREAGGKAVIAHPHLIYDPQTLSKLLKMDFDGIEAYYGRFMQTKAQQWIEVAEARGWLITGGSDFHGSIRPQSPLGSSWISTEFFKPLRDLFIANNPK